LIGNFGLWGIAPQFAVENQESRIRNLKFPPLAALEGLLAGRVLAGRYRIEEVIGRGSMGAVYRAVDECLGRPVAVKVINVAVSDPKQAEELRTRFQREARVAASLHHPNVIIVYDFGTDSELGLDFLVMELLHGEDLANRMARSGPPSLSTSLRILWEAGRGLAVGHRAGLTIASSNQATSSLRKTMGWVSCASGWSISGSPVLSKDRRQPAGSPGSIG
jgi:serine/threonine protein kinase